MGCWNETCMVSHLPIFENDKVAMMLIIPRFSDDGPVSITAEYDDAWMQLGFPFIGKYDEYGGIKNVEKNRMNKQFFKNCVNLYYVDDAKQGLREYKFESSEQFCADIVNGELYVKGEDDEFAQIEYGLIHHDLYVDLILEIGSRIPYPTDTTYATCLKEKMSKISESYRRNANLYPTGQISALFDVSSKYDPLEFFLRHNASHDTIVELIEFLIWKQVMTKLRKGYFSLCGRGSQSSEMYLHKMVAEFVLRKCEERIEENKKSMAEPTLCNEKITNDMLRGKLYRWG